MTKTGQASRVLMGGFSNLTVPLFYSKTAYWLRHQFASLPTALLPYLYCVLRQHYTGNKSKVGSPKT